MNEIERILRKRTINLFNDEWYEYTSLAISNIKNQSKGYVYFIKNSHMNEIKIGKSFNMTKRMKSFRTSYSSDIYLIGYVYCEDFNELEIELHKKYNSKRIQGEWFSVSQDDIINEIEDNKGYVVKSYLNTKSKFIDGMPLDIPGERSSSNPFWDEFYEELDKLKLNEYYSKGEFYDKIISNYNKYKLVSKKKMEMMRNEYSKLRGYNYSTKNSAGLRYFSMRG